MKKNWYKIGISEINTCGNCESEFRGLADLDHHSSVCPNCEIECIWYYIDKEKSLQIIPKYAPSEVKMFIDWAQKELDEIEFIELISSFESIVKEINDI